MTIIGRIQIVKIFIIPIFLYRASLISVNREFVKDVNKIIFDFISNGNDKVIEDGGLKAPHLDSMIETHRVLCCKKKLASDQPSNWKKFSCTILNLWGVNLSYVTILISRNCP